MGNKSVLVAMSGGVDSSGAAFLLKERGYEVIGLTLDIATENNAQSMGKSIENARTVAEHIGIEHHVLDLRRQFDQKVVTVFCEEYRRGRTPNPCVLCNPEIKFGPLVAEAHRLGVASVATGHYARVAWDEQKQRYVLKKGKDEQKEQSYFLFMLGQEHLAHTAFPLGELTKEKVRQKARELGLSVHDRRGSQEVCFIPDNDYSGFVKKRMPDIQVPGKIISTKGEVLGEHSGIHSYTVGQRRGLNVPQGYPVYVVALDPATNTVVVGKKEETFGNELIASHMNWIACEAIKTPLSVKARIRYRTRAHAAQVIPLGPDSVKVVFDESQMAITPGQAVVFYQGDIVVGGGWIEG